MANDEKLFQIHWQRHDSDIPQMNPVPFTESRADYLIARVSKFARAGIIWKEPYVEQPSIEQPSTNEDDYMC